VHFPREIRAGVSKRIMAGLVAGHILVGVGFGASSLGGLAKAGGYIALVISLAAGVHRQKRQARLGLLLREDGLLAISPPGEDGYLAQPGRSCVDFGWAVWLAWKEEGERPRRSAVRMVAADAMPAEDWRHLRAWLRHKAAFVRPHSEQP
jgi:hypothetical protein